MGHAIPNKLYFRIGEVSELVGVKPYVLRYWESEFSDIKPSKSKSGQRLYKRRDVEMLLRIKELLYDERFTIDGARKRLKDIVRGEAKDIPAGAEALPKPRQLEVFDLAGGKPALNGAKALQAGQKGTGGREGAKVLIKIRRDLESLLDVVRSDLA